MKKIFLLVLLALSLVYWSGCDKIEGNHFETTTATNDTGTEVYRVLLEDYTGHTCGNCPAASRNLYNNIKPVYGSRLVTIGVHADYFAEPCPPHVRPPNSPVGSYADDFRTTAGTDWYNFFTLYSNPLGMVNRVGYNNTHIKTSTAWGTAIAGIINNKPKVTIAIDNIYDNSSRQLNISTETKFLSSLSGVYKLTVVLTEDSIKTWQLDDFAANHNDSTYYQRHVLRGALNGSFGEKIDTASTISSGKVIVKQYTTTLPSGWNANHVHAVVFLFDNANYEILNVTEAAVIE